MVNQSGAAALVEVTASMFTGLPLRRALTPWRRAFCPHGGGQINRECYMENPSASRRTFLRAGWFRPSALLAWLVAMLLPSLLDPELGFRASLLAQAVNAAWPLAVMWLVWGLGGRAWLALACEIALLGGLRFADHVKLVYLNTGLVYADFAAIPGLLSEPRLVLGFIRPSAKQWLGLLVALTLMAAVAWRLRRRAPLSWRWRGFHVVVAVAALASMARAHISYTVPSLGWSAWSQRIGAGQVGVAGNILLGRMVSHNATRVADPMAERAFWNEPLVRRAQQQMAAGTASVRPDIVIVQSESLFEPSLLRGFADAPVLRRIVGEHLPVAGHLKVPVFGGRTLQTEFEVLTGTPVAFYPGSMFAYFEVMGSHSIAALPRILADQGYATTLVHPNGRGFWHRDRVMPEMGFATFQDIGSFLYPRDYSDRSYVSDAALTHAVLAELDGANRPTFVTAISIENHGPWGQYPPVDDHGLGLPAGLHGATRARLGEYVQHAIAADQAYGYLIDTLRQRARPVIVLIYGDHLPALPDVYHKLGFKDGEPAEQHDPPFRIWANFPIPTPPSTTSAYLLQGWLLHAAGLPLQGQLLANYLAGVIANDAAAPAAERQRVLEEYANIAAANVATPVAARGVDAGTVFIGHDHLAGIVHRMAAPDARSATAVADGEDVTMRAAAGQSAQLDFAPLLGVASVSLRPYLAASCHPLVDGQAVFDVRGDGRLLYRTILRAGSLRLATLDLRGTRQLSLRVEAMPAGPGCDGVHVRIAQLLCYSVDCARPGPAAPPRSALSPPRESWVPEQADQPAAARQ